MGQKHNRRRTRPRSRPRANPFASTQRFQQALSSHDAGHAFLQEISTVCHQYHHAHANYDPSVTSPSSLQLPSHATLPAFQPSPLRHKGWHSQVQRQMAKKLEADQYRLFGGEPGDDIALCYRMLEYFGGLDFIDT
ncbi:hypothetical protein FQN57_004740 [Myotisia sp. PD_48]|nr:hypothetical protein FQN57_004740 [Myotisia sp. PD_48]